MNNERNVKYETRVIASKNKTFSLIIYKLCEQVLWFRFANKNILLIFRRNSAEFSSRFKLHFNSTFALNSLKISLKQFDSISRRSNTIFFIINSYWLSYFNCTLLFFSFLLCTLRTYLTRFNRISVNLRYQRMHI